jgi:hypothetical protein
MMEHPSGRAEARATFLSAGDTGHEVVGHCGPVVALGQIEADDHLVEALSQGDVPDGDRTVVLLAAWRADVVRDLPIPTVGDWLDAVNAVGKVYLLSVPTPADGVPVQRPRRRGWR